MLKKLSLIMLILINSSAIQADFSGSNFWGAFLGALLGSRSNSNRRPSSDGRNLETLCISGCNSKCEVVLPCGDCMCRSCHTSARDTALRHGTNLVCKKCGKTSEEYQPALAAPVRLPNDRAVLCASGCNSKSEVSLQCQGNHHMCQSCLRSRVQTAKKEAGAGEPYVTCPRCNDMLTESVIGKFGQQR